MGLDELSSVVLRSRQTTYLNAWFNSCCYPPPPHRKHTPGDLRFSLQCMNVNAGNGRKHVSMGHIFHEMIRAARLRLIDQEYGNVIKALKVCIHVAYSLK